jgi:hypothetical protein
MAREKTDYSAYADYAKLLKKKCQEESSSSSGCSDCSGGCSDCNDCSDEKCGCCPAGLVAVEDANGNHIGCLTPNDAQLYMTDTYKCPDGYIRVTSGTGVSMIFIGCLTPAEYAVYVAAIPA